MHKCIWRRLDIFNAENKRARGRAWKVLQPRGNIFNWFHAYADSRAAGWRAEEGKDKNDKDFFFFSTIESL